MAPTYVITVDTIACHSNNNQGKTKDSNINIVKRQYSQCKALTELLFLQILWWLTPVRLLGQQTQRDSTVSLLWIQMWTCTLPSKMQQKRGKELGFFSNPEDNTWNKIICAQTHCHGWVLLLYILWCRGQKSLGIPSNCGLTSCPKTRGCPTAVSS